MKAKDLSKWLETIPEYELKFAYMPKNKQMFKKLILSIPLAYKGVIEEEKDKDMFLLRMVDKDWDIEDMYIYASDSQIDSYFYGDYERAVQHGWERYEYSHLPKDCGIYGWRLKRDGEKSRDIRS